MDCRTFRKKHLAFVDDTLPGIDLAEMYRHVEECEHCAGHDARVRRGLMLVRNLPAIEPSSDFSARLEARLREVRLADRHPELLPRRTGLFGGFGVRSYSALAASLTIIGYVGYVAATAADRPHMERELTLAPVIATQPEPALLPIADPVLVASFSTGLPVWPAAMLAEEAPVQFATPTVNPAIQTVYYTGR